MVDPDVRDASEPVILDVPAALVLVVAVQWSKPDETGPGSLSAG